MRRLIAMLLMLWFPVQGWAALAMPFCQHAANAAMTAETLAQPVADVAEHCQQHNNKTSPAGAQPVADSAQCDHCAACHLAHTPMLMPLPLNLSGSVPTQRVESPAVFYYQIFPEQPQRPPLARLV